MNKNKFIGFLIAIMLLVGMGFSQNAYAGTWQKSTGGWNYLDNGTKKTGWLQDNNKWYYLNSQGNMITGWIPDQGKWYYLREDGSLNDSKTISTIPSEIQATYNIVKSFAGSLSIKYIGKGYIDNKSAFNSFGIKEKWISAFKAEDQYGNLADFYYVYDPYSCKVYKLYADFKVEYLGQGNMTNSINTDQVKQILQKHLSDNNIDIPNLTFNITDEKENSYFALCQQINVDHINTVEHYYVDKTTGDVYKSGNY
jgi:hypothetical protein